MQKTFRCGELGSCGCLCRSGDRDRSNGGEWAGSEVSPVMGVAELSFRCQGGGGWDAVVGRGQHREVDKRSLGRG